MSSAVFPALPGVAWGIVKRPMWNSRLQTSVGGIETRVAFASLPRWRWALPFQFLRQNATNAELQQLADFFNARQGRYDSFLYDDPSDDTIADDATSRAAFGTIGTGDAAKTTFQLGRSLVSSGVLEPIYNAHGTPKVYKNTTLQVNPTDYTISASGLITFASAPAGGVAIRWSGSWYWRARFDQDTADLTAFASGFWSLSELAFVSILGS